MASCDPSDFVLASAPGSVAALPPHALELVDWRVLYDREWARADGAEIRAETAEAQAGVQRRRGAEAVHEQSQAGFWKSVAERRGKALAEVSSDLSALQRSLKDVRALEAEVARLRRLLDDAHVDPRKRGTNTALRMAFGKLRAAHADAEARIVHLERENASLRETRETLSKAAFGRKSEQQAKPRSARKRGQQRGAKGHGRTQRPSLEKKIEEHRPAPEDSVCGTCGMPHVENGYHDSELIEIEVKAHKRVLRRIRLRKACACPGTGAAQDAPRREVSEPPVPRLFRNTPFGLSVWAFVLVECFAFHRPVRRVAAWLADFGVTIAPGTLSSRLPCLHDLFTPVSQAIRARMNSTR